VDEICYEEKQCGGDVKTYYKCMECADGVLLCVQFEELPIGCMECIPSFVVIETVRMETCVQCYDY
jgi:hypothetical protein